MWEGIAVVISGHGVTSNLNQAAVHLEINAGYEATLVGSQKQCRGGELLGTTNSTFIGAAEAKVSLATSACFFEGNCPSIH